MSQPDGITEETLLLHGAVENEDLRALRDLLDGGGDVHAELEGVTLLHHAVGVESDGHARTGGSPHVDTTAYLLARGANPLRRSSTGRDGSAWELAIARDHWPACELFAAWLNRTGP